MRKQYYVYILASGRNGTLYVGMTNDIIQRVYQHKNELVDGFTKKYHIHDLVYFEQGSDALAMIDREKQIKAWQRKWKIRLIEENNPMWQDLYPALIGQ